MIYWFFLKPILQTNYLIFLSKSETSKLLLYSGDYHDIVNNLVIILYGEIIRNTVLDLLVDNIFGIGTFDMFGFSYI